MYATWPVGVACGLLPKKREVWPRTQAKAIAKNLNGTLKDSSPLRRRESANYCKTISSQDYPVTQREGTNKMRLPIELTVLIYVVFCKRFKNVGALCLRILD